MEQKRIYIGFKLEYNNIIIGGLCLIPDDPAPAFNWVFENQLIASGILTQPSRYNRDGKGP